MASVPSTDIAVAVRLPCPRVSAMAPNAASTSASPKAAWAAAQAGPSGITQARPDAVVYVAHLPSIDMLSPGAVAEMEANFDHIARELQTAASEQLRDREERWRFERRQGLIPDELIAAAAGIRDALPEDTVVIVVGSSSHAMHRVVGSVAVSLARRSAVPLVVVP